MKKIDILGMKLQYSVWLSLNWFRSERLGGTTGYWVGDKDMETEK
jgi:hypothetical protein